jgi:transcriptional regulator with XRE-family HTH domain
MPKDYSITREVSLEAPANGSVPPKAARNLEFGRKLRAAMLARGMKQIQLSDETKIGRDSISGYARGRIYPSPDRIKTIAEVLGVKPEDLAVEEQSVRFSASLQEFEMKMLGGDRAWVTMNKEVPAKIASEMWALAQEANAVMAKNDAKKSKP